MTWSFFVWYKKFMLPYMALWVLSNTAGVFAPRNYLPVGWNLWWGRSGRSLKRKSSILLIFKDIENLAFFKTGEESRFRCNAVFWFSPFCRRRRDCSNSLVPLPRKSGVMIWVHENSVAVRCSLKLKHKCLQKQGFGNWGSVRHEDDLQIKVYTLMKPNIKPLINRAV